MAGKGITICISQFPVTRIRYSNPTILKRRELQSWLRVSRSSVHVAHLQDRSHMARWSRERREELGTQTHPFLSWPYWTTPSNQELPPNVRIQEDLLDLNLNTIYLHHCVSRVRLLIKFWLAHNVSSWDDRHFKRWTVICWIITYHKLCFFLGISNSAFFRNRPLCTIFSYR